MTKEEKIEEIRQRARKNFSLGYNCAECVTEAILSLVDTGLPPAVKKVATGFGGGIGLFGDTCGALAGAVMAVSAVHGRDTLPEGADQKDVAMKSKAQFYGKPGVYRIFNVVPNRFKAKYGLKHMLASDAELKAAQAYGVWGEKTLYGRKYMGMERATFLIDAKGVIREIWRKVKVSGHVEAVLAAAKAL